MRLVAYSRGDVAGSNIAGILRSEFKLDGKLFVECDDFATNVSFLTDLKPEVCFIASRHRSESKMPTLTAHVTGNFGKAELGGEDRELALAPALYLREAVRGLLKYGSNSGCSISLEVTHHGPTNLPFPLVFVEVGSALEQWNDLNACRIAAKVINDLMACKPEKVPVAIGFGGPHYAPNFTAVIEKVALGHIMSKYAIEHASKEMIKQMIEKTVPKPQLALFDWKGLSGGEKQMIIAILDELNLPWKKTSELK
ncbi:MAG: D-tyrosyl-tRNA(Tyr) deacylase [Candidatus Altiarchaeales archaeon]|nr:D-tyrosyl-tRNA(Tyr) deacylase [Candidatus Altiarchaeales archaeon]